MGDNLYAHPSEKPGPEWTEYCKWGAETEAQAWALRRALDFGHFQEDVADFVLVEDRPFSGLCKTLWVNGRPLGSAFSCEDGVPTPQEEIDAYCERCRGAGNRHPLDRRFSDRGLVNVAIAKWVRENHPAFTQPDTVAHYAPEPPAPKPQPDRAAILAHAAKLPPAKRARYLASKGVA